MPPDLSQLLIVLTAWLGAILLARFLARAMARRQPAQTPGIPPAALPAPAAGPPMPREIALARFLAPARPLVVRERPKGRLNLADARKGIVLATILGPCRAHSPDDDHRF